MVTVEFYGFNKNKIKDISKLTKNAGLKML